MAEQFVGTKFRTVFARGEAAGGEELVKWCRRWAAVGYIGKAMGNLSCRNATGFVITPTGSDPRLLTVEDLVEVTGVQFLPAVLTVAGKHEPSSESLMHATIYGARPGIGAVFHGHSDRLLAGAGELGLPVTRRERPYGTAAMGDEVLDVLSGHVVVIMRGHGFVATGKTMADANRAVEQVMAKL